MKKKILSLMLVFVMILSLTACGSKGNASSEKAKNAAKNASKKETTLVDVIEAIKKTDVKGSEAVCEIMGYKAESKLNVDGENYQLSVSVDGEKVTDVVYVDEVLYVNVKDAVDFVSNLYGEDLSSYLSMFGIESDYVKISKDDLLSLVEEAGTLYSINVGDYTEATEDYEKYEKFINILTKFASDYLEGAKSDLGDAIKIEGTLVKVKLNNENILEVLEAFKKVDVKPLLEKLFEDLAKEDVMEDDVDIDEVVEEFNGELDALIEEYKDVKDDCKFTISAKYGVENKKVVLDAQFDATVEDEKYEGNIEVSTTDKSTKITAPGDAADVIEIYNELMATVYQN